MCAYLLKAQHPAYIHLSEKDGLPDIEFYDLHEDKKGFVWLAADKGLYRYDGKEFKKFTNQNKKRSSVFGLLEDEKGRMWCTNISGQFFYTEGESLITYIDFGDKLRGQLGAFSIIDSTLYINASKELYKINLSTKEETSILKSPRFDLGGPLFLKDKIYINYDESLVEIDLNGETLNKINTKFFKEVYSKILGRAGMIQLNGQFYMVCNLREETGLYHFDVENNLFEEVELPMPIRSQVTAGIVMYENEVWFLTTNGIQRCDIENNKLIYNGTYFQGEYVTDVIKDRDQNYWVSTHKNGVFVIPNIHVNQHELPIKTENISCIEKINDDLLFFGTIEGEVGIYDINKKKTKVIPLPMMSKVYSLMYNPFDEKMYISQDTGAFIYDLNSEELKRSDYFSNAKNLTLVDEDTFIFTTYSFAKLVHKVPDEEKFVGEYLNSKRSYTAHYHEETGKYYVAYVDDLFMHDKELKSKIIRDGETPIFAVSMAETNNETIWASTHTNGIYGIVNDSVFINYTTKNGLLSNEVDKIIGDERLLWISTDKGIQLLDTEQGTFQILTKRDGILSYGITGIQLLGDEVFFSSNKGLFSVEKERVFKKRASPEVYLTGIEINEKDTLLLNKFQLPYDQNAIKFSFNANGFQSKEHIQYKSRLIGFNDTWINVDKGSDFVKYNSLPVGNYTFEVKATSLSSKVESKVVAVQIVIQNPFWKKMWFIISLILLVLLLIFLYYRNLLKKREKEKNILLDKVEQERELVFLKLENLRSQMNPHFIFNALNSIQEYIILNKKNLASDYLGKFADLIRTYLHHSNRGIIYLQEELNCLEMYLELEELRFEDKLKYELSVEESVDTEMIMIPTMLIQPYVENALKHGLLHKKGNGKLTISIQSATAEYIVCIIEDDGVGREKAFAIKARKDKTYESIGTQVTQDRLDLLNYGKEKPIGVVIEDLYEEGTGNSKGTKVVITIPTSNMKKLKTKN